MWCNTAQSVQDAVTKLKNCKRVVLACEGGNLGDESGQLSIISVGTHDADSIFLFDARSLSRTDIQPLVDFLSSQQVPKLMWDGRREAIEMRREFGVQIGRPWDLQLVDITSRIPRARRKQSIKAPKTLEPVAHMDLEGVHALPSIQCVLGAHRIPRRAELVQGIMDHTLWLQRPLPDSYVRYAESDVRIIARIAEVFMSRGYCSKGTASLIEQQSARYLAVNDRPLSGNNVFICSNLLPMGVLGNVPASGANLQQCDKCSRSLDSSCFVYSSRRDRSGVRSHSSCKVCNVLVELRRIEASQPLSQTQREPLQVSEPPSNTQVTSVPTPPSNTQATSVPTPSNTQVSSASASQPRQNHQNENQSRSQSQKKGKKTRGNGRSKPSTTRAAAVAGQAPRRPPKASSSGRQRYTASDDWSDDFSRSGLGWPDNMSMRERRSVAEYALEKGWWAHAEILDPGCMSHWDL